MSGGGIEFPVKARGSICPDAGIRIFKNNPRQWYN